jgi:excisionase family DNA binding protein
MQERLRVSEVAEVLRVAPITVRRMDARGELHSLRDWRGHRVFELEEVLRVKEKRERLVEAAPEEHMPTREQN